MLVLLRHRVFIPALIHYKGQGFNLHKLVVRSDNVHALAVDSDPDQAHEKEILLAPGFTATEIQGSNLVRELN